MRCDSETVWAEAPFSPSFLGAWVVVGRDVLCGRRCEELEEERGLMGVVGALRDWLWLLPCPLPVVQIV